MFLPSTKKLLWSRAELIEILKITLFPGDESAVLQSVGLKEHTLIKSLDNRPEQK